MTLPKNDGLPSIDRLREVFDYNPDTGVIIRRIGKYASEKPAGSANGHGYLSLNIDRKRVMAHRLAWAIHHGEWPEQFVDHVNMVRDDNRIANLRLAGKSQNNQNRSKTLANTSGFKGVYWHKKAKRWYSIGVVHRKQKYLGLYDTPEEASEAYKAFTLIAAGNFARIE